LAAHQEAVRQQRDAIRQEAEAAQQAQEREQRLTQTIQGLAGAYPAYHFAFYPGDAGMVPINATLTKSCVRTLYFSRAGDVLSVDVSLIGIQPQNEGPTVFVALWDEAGNLIARTAIVEFTSADLGDGETQEVQDTMTLPPNSQPVFVSVDEGANTI
jgi:hypothetical protein